MLILTVNQIVDPVAELAVMPFYLLSTSMLTVDHHELNSYGILNMIHINPVKSKMTNSWIRRGRTKA